jgi:alpha-L-fucosidase 2
MPGIEVNHPRAEHGLHYSAPAMTWDEAFPLGNGILGALVWGNGKPLKVSLDRTDLWDLRAVPEFHSAEYTYEQMVRWHHEGRTKDLVRLYEAPYERADAPTKIPAGRIELSLGNEATFAKGSLLLEDAKASMQLNDGTEAEVIIHATRPVGMIAIRSAGKVAARLIAPPFGGKGKPGEGSLAKLGYPPPGETSGETWQAFTQKGSQGFHFAVYLAWRDTQEGWQAAWSVASSFEGADPLGIAKARVDAALQAGFEKTRASHARWWKDYWQKSSVRLPNRIVERQWFLEQYKFGSASRRGSPPITLQGPWTADNGELPPWKGDYHHDLNTQLSYWPCYSGNRLEEGLSYLDWLWKTRANCVDWTRRFFQLPGMNVPMTADLNNNQIGGWRQYTHSATTAAWLAQHFYLHWRYSADGEFLRDRAYPYLKDCSIFIEAVTSKKGPDGKRTLPLSASPEINDNRPSAWFTNITNFDLALIRWLLGATAELADALNLRHEAQHWRQVLSEMPDFACGDDGRLLIAKDYPLPASHRHFSHLMAIHPLGLIDWDQGEQARRTIRAALAELERLGPDWWCGYSYAWLANLAARARDGKRAERALEVFSTAFTLRNSFHCNGDQSGKGYSKMTYRPFTLEGNFAAAAGVQEMLLQSQGGKIRIFPAIPDGWKDVSFTTLRAEGAFLISARRTGGKTERVEVVAEKGGPCRLVSPFSGREIAVDMKEGEHLALTQDP